MLRLAALDGQVTSWLDMFGPLLFYALVWGLVFAGTGLFIGVFIPFVTGDSLLFAAGIVSAGSGGVNIWVLAIGVGIAAFLGTDLGWWAVVVGRFIPWGRVLVPPVAGIARMDYLKFVAANLVGALVWGVLLTVTGYFAASIPAVKSAAYVIGGAFILGAIIAGILSWRRNRVAA